MTADIGVLLVFFNKVETTEQVFDKILEAKPERLFLAQDGPRESNASDQKSIKYCREMIEEKVNKIDWECAVYRNYSEKNLTCDPRVFSAISWAFQYTDKLIILEDDCFCTASFFEFMSELLEKYSIDNRIQMISGIERFGVNQFCKNSYYFTQANCGCAWATWKRIWNEVEEMADCSFLDDKELCIDLQKYADKCCIKSYHNFIDRAHEYRILNERVNGVASWEFALAAAGILHSRVSINPAVNLVKNIGIVEGATHSGGNLNTLPKRIRKLFELETYEMEFPLKHPQYVMRDMRYEEQHEKVFCPGRFRLFCEDIERLLLRFRHGEAKEVYTGLKRRLQRSKTTDRRG